MSSISSTKFTKERLFADLEKNEITVDKDTLAKAKNGDGDAMFEIGLKYNNEERIYDKAFAWHRLAAVKNNHWAQNALGVMHHLGHGVPVDCLQALEWYLKAAIQHNKVAWGNIGECFEEGTGVPVDKYKALEWYYKSGKKIENVVRRFKALREQGIKLRQKDKDKSIEQLILETEDIFWKSRNEAKSDTREEADSLKQSKAKAEKESRAKDDKIMSLEVENQKLRVKAERKQQELDAKQHELDTIHQELDSKQDELDIVQEELDAKQQELEAKHYLIEQYKNKEQSTNGEIQLLKQVMNAFGARLDNKESEINLLENEIKQVQSASEKLSQSTTKKIDELEKSNQYIQKLLEQERQLKANEIELVKQKMDFLSETVKQTRTELDIVKQSRSEPDNGNPVMKRKLIDVSASSLKRLPSESSSTKNNADENNGYSNGRGNHTSEAMEYKKIKIENDDTD